MVIVELGSEFFSEWRYTIDVLFGEILQISYVIMQVEANPYHVIKFDVKDFRIHNAHYNKKEYTYPERCEEGELIIGGKNVRIQNLYGKLALNISENGATLESDIISASFFMLSRWEESAIVVRDIHDRFESKEALSIKENFYRRPIVNEYAEIFRTIFYHFGIGIGLKRKKATLEVSHDIDHTVKWNTWYKAVKTGFDQGNLGFKELWQYMFGHNTTNDPYFNFDIMLKIAEERAMKLTYYFAGIMKHHSPYDHFDYDINDKELGEIIQKVLSLGHEVGLHPSYNSYNNKKMVEMEKINLEKVCKTSLKKTRQHYLRYDINLTPRILDELGFDSDSSMHYSIGPGFRTGCCQSHSMYDTVSKKKLNIKQQPLIFMDTHYIHQEEGILIEAFTNVTKEVKKYNGEMTVLWHNNNLFPQKKVNKYQKVLDLWHQ
jgi:hypothetical protein